MFCSLANSVAEAGLQQFPQVAARGRPPPETHKKRVFKFCEHGSGSILRSGGSRSTPTFWVLQVTEKFDGSEAERGGFQEGGEVGGGDWDWTERRSDL